MDWDQDRVVRNLATARWTKGAAVNEGKDAGKLPRAHSRCGKGGKGRKGLIKGGGHYGKGIGPVKLGSVTALRQGREKRAFLGRVIARIWLSGLGKERGRKGGKNE